MDCCTCFSTNILKTALLKLFLNQQSGERIVTIVFQSTSLRMPAPVFFSIVGDVPLLRILRESGLDDMNVRDGWDIHIAVAYCWEISLYLYRNYFFTPAYKGNRLFHDKTWTYHHMCVCVWTGWIHYVFMQCCSSFKLRSTDTWEK